MGKWSDLNACPMVDKVVFLTSEPAVLMVVVVVWWSVCVALGVCY